MRGYLKIVTAIFLHTFIFSCNDEEDLEKDLDTKGYSLYCWPSKTACDNKEYGIEFSYRGAVITLPGQPVVLPRLATLVCCTYIQSLIDTLTVYNDLLKTRRQQGTNLNRSCDIGPDITVHVEYSTGGLTQPKSFALLGFRDRNHPRGFDISIPSFEDFDAFKEDLMAKQEECCSREEDK